MLYNILIYPLETVFKHLYLLIEGMTGSYGASLVLLSIGTTIIIIPFMKWAMATQAKERHLQEILKPQLESIKASSTGKERHRRISNLYKRYAYHPVYAIRSAAGVALQVPFLLAAYYMLSNLDAIKGVSFAFIPDLSRPDGLLGGINALPILMTLINMASAYTTASFGKKEKLQAFVIAALFLLLLYNAPSALLIFWTCNNLWMLVGNLLAKTARPSRLSINMPQSGKIKISAHALNNPVFIIPLACTVPIIFSLSLNYFMYTAAQMAFSLAISLAFGTALSLICVHAGNKILSLLKIKPKIKDALIRCACAAIAVAIVVVLVNQSLIIFFPATKLRIAIYLSAMALTTLLAAYTGAKTINLFLLLWGIVSILNSFSATAPPDIAITASPQIHNIDKPDFKNKPDVFLFIIESLPRIDTLENLYEVDASELKNFLKEKSFDVYENMYSNYSPTAGSSLSLVTQEHQYYKYHRGNFALSPEGAQIVSDKDNFLYGSFRKNNYRLYSIDHGGKVVSINAGAFDEVNREIVSPTSPVVLLAPIANMSFRLGKIIGGEPPTTNQMHNLEVVKKDLIKISEKIDTTKPSFFVVHYDIIHEIAKYGGTCDSVREKWRLEYKILYAELEKEMIKAMDYVINKYPDAVVILIGDHGSRHHAVCRCNVDFSNPKEFMQSHNFTQEWLTEDTFSAMGAVRWPKGLKKFSNGKPISHVNLFTHIFSSLAEDPSILNNAADSKSYLLSGGKDLYLTVQDGKPVIPWQKVEPVKK